MKHVTLQKPCAPRFFWRWLLFITQENYVLLHVVRSLTISEVELACAVRHIFRLQIVMAARAKGNHDIPTGR